MAYTRLDQKAVGSIVKLRENGVIAEYIVVQQGQPHAMYDASCNGTWLLRKDILEMRQWHPVGDNRYASSEIHAYLNNTFAARFDAAIFGAIKQVKIPYAAGHQSGAVYSGANGLTTRAFLLGGSETGLPTDGKFSGYLLSDGAKLAYFDYGASAQPKRQANYNGQLTEWYLRSPGNQNTEYVFSIEKYGLNDLRCPMTTNPLGIRPALIMSSAVYTLDDGTIVTNQPPGVPASISYPANISGGTTITVSWGAAADADGNLAGYQLERSVNGGGWGLIYQGGALSFSDGVTFGWNTVAYRVRAYDSVNEFSGDQTGATRTVFNNQPPAISGSDGGLGVKTAAFSTAYTVSDANPGQAVTVVETLNGKHKRTFNVTNSLACSFEVTAAEWRELLNGTHTIKITATDTSGAAVARTLTFQKNETELDITAVLPQIPSERPAKGIINLTRQIPAASSLIVEVCNNARDAAPTWQDVSSAVKNGQKFFLPNTQKTAAQWGFGIRVRVYRLGAAGECWISAIGGNFE